MSLYDKMGLLITPNGVAPSKIFAYKPTNGSGDGVFDRNTTATRVNSVGLIEEVAIDMARIDYPTNGSCPHLLFEPQSTNLVAYSEDFTDSSYIKTRLSITSDVILSPDGTLNGSKVVENTQLSTRRLYTNSNIIVSGKSYTLSIFAKKSERDTFNLVFGNNGFAGVEASFDLENGTTNLISGDSSLIENYGNGWYKCSLTGTSDANGSDKMSIYMTNPINNRSYQGDGISGFYLFGYQLEALPYPTSYIPTNGSAVTRVKDVANNFGDVNTFNSEEGVLFVEMAALSNDLTSREISISDGTTTNRIELRYSSVSNRIQALIRVSGSIQSNMTFVASDITLFSKIALKYKANDFSLYVDGSEVSTDSSGSVFPLSVLNVLSFNQGDGGNVFLGKVKQVQVYKEALTDLELEYLTTYATFPDLANANNYNLILNT